MPNIYDTIEAQRARLLKKEMVVTSNLEGLYGNALLDLEQQAVRAATAVEARVTAGSSPTLAMLEENRIQALIRQTSAEFYKLGEQAIGVIDPATRDAVIATASDFEAMAEGTAIKAGINPEAVLIQALALQDDSPLTDLFAGAFQDVAHGARQALFNGIASNKNPRQVAKDFRQVGDIEKNRAQTIARTEMLRSYRTAMLRQYKAGGLGGWVWISARDRRTCAYCWSRHGSEHPLDEVMATHPNCRCSQGPLDMLRAPNSTVTLGSVEFERLPEADKRFILGPAKYRAMQDGAITLSDLAGTGVHPLWGPVGFEKPLSAILGPGAKQYYRQAAKHG